MSRPVIVLVGMMGAGKSAVGRAIAQRIGCHYVDNDDLVEQATGADPAGGARGRRRERLAGCRVDCPRARPVAGGVELDPANRARLLAVPAVVWLRARPDTLIRRVGDGAGRPWLQPDPAAAITRLAAAREMYYAEVANAIVDVDGLRAEALAGVVLRAVQ